MPQDLILCSDAAQLGRSLRTWRNLRRVKQNHAAELLGVSQATISRWESGVQAPMPDEQAAIRLLLQARLDSAADRELARLVRAASGRMHLVCDLTHKLLAYSDRIEADWRVPGRELLGVSLWRYASEEIIAAEAQLASTGWFEPAPDAIELYTRENRSDEVPIFSGKMRWVRFQLSDGSFARLTETALPDGFVH
ncbi:helix-turn-helix domain-containing protein [Roseiterribacter gracilis]|uniref:Transcriptional regulator n=1 Tax=Roseiterribacter gracilis TaxID=2812848 RepID=A0A8S8X9Z2_9PROT|nr:transcriptional regulator [Rhodospirillales bacterium TMPK1]